MSKTNDKNIKGSPKNLKPKTTDNKKPKAEHHNMDMDKKMDKNMTDMEMDMSGKSAMPKHEKMTSIKNSGIPHSMHMANFKRIFFISLLIAIPIFLFSPMMGIRLPFQISFVGSNWIVFICATILFIYGGSPFLKGARMELQMKNPAMMTLISLGISVSYLYSVYGFLSSAVFRSTTTIMSFFWEFASLILIMLLGHWIEMNAIGKAGNALQKMASLLPPIAHLVKTDGSIEELHLEMIKGDDIVLVKAGEAIPTDGSIVEGKTTVNESLITGEAKNIRKTIDDKVIGGSINGSGTIKVRVTGTGENSYLAQVMRLVDEAQKDKSKIETLSDKVAKWLFYIALCAGATAFVVWLIMSKDVSIALSRMVTVLIIACPHALGLAIPLVIARSTSLGAAHGLLLRNRKALEVAKNIDTILMDKTGTLTSGNFSVTLLKSFSEDFDENQILSWFSALETYSDHPLSVGILKDAKKKKIEIPTANHTLNMKGVGLSGTINRKKYTIVSGAYLDKNGIPYDKNMYQDATNKAYSVSFLLQNKHVLGMVALGDKIKPDAKKLIHNLQDKNINSVMLTGDNQQAAQAVSTALGIKEFHANLMPDDKEKIVRDYQQKGKKVMMVGDGINDAPALVRADIGVAIGSGTDVAIDSADVILVKNDPVDILIFLTLAKQTMKKMTQNIWWGAGYNILAIPLAAGVLAPVGVVLTPAIGAVLMSLSTVIVALNAMTLTLKKRDTSLD